MGLFGFVFGYIYTFFFLENFTDLYVFAATQNLPEFNLEYFETALFVSLDVKGWMEMIHGKKK